MSTCVGSLSSMWDGYGSICSLEAMDSNICHSKFSISQILKEDSRRKSPQQTSIMSKPRNLHVTNHKRANGINFLLTLTTTRRANLSPTGLDPKTHFLCLFVFLQQLVKATVAAMKKNLFAENNERVIYEIFCCELFSLFS